MSNLVKIDRSTVRKNPRAGATSTIVHKMTSAVVVETARDGHQSIGTRELQSLGNLTFEEGDDGRTVTGEFVTTRIEKRTNFMPFSTGQHLSWQISDPPQRLTFLTDRPEPNVKIICDKEVVNHAPLADWLYSYEDSLVTCENGHTHRFSDLDRDEIFEAHHACPVCHEIVEFEHEKIADVVKEMGLA